MKTKLLSVLVLIISSLAINTLRGMCLTRESSLRMSELDFSKAEARYIERIKEELGNAFNLPVLAGKKSILELTHAEVTAHKTEIRDYLAYFKSDPVFNAISYALEQLRKLKDISRFRMPHDTPPEYDNQQENNNPQKTESSKSTLDRLILTLESLIRIYFNHKVLLL